MHKFLIISFFTLLVVACSPQKRLDRLLKNNPELVKTDTVKKDVILYLPGKSIDTTFKANSQVNGLNEILKHYHDVLDSIRRIKLTQELKTYIINRECLKDTFFIALNNGGYCKIWQKGQVFFYQLHQPGTHKTIRVPVTVNQVQGVIKNDWKFFWIGSFCVVFFILIFNIILKWIKP